MQRFSHTAELSLLGGMTRLTFCLPKLKMRVALLRHDSRDQITDIMTQLSQHQRAGGSKNTRLFPWWSCQSPANNRGPHVRPREALHQWDSGDVFLYWSSLLSGFLSGHSVPSAWKIPRSPISRDDSPPLSRSRRRAEGCFQ